MADNATYERILWKDLLSIFTAVLDIQIRIIQASNIKYVFVNIMLKESFRAGEIFGFMKYHSSLFGPILNLLE